MSGFLLLVLLLIVQYNFTSLCSLKESVYCNFLLGLQLCVVTLNPYSTMIVLAVYITLFYASNNQ